MLNTLEFNKYQSTGYLPKKNQNRKEYFKLWWEKNKREYNHKRRQKYASKKVSKQSLLERLTYQYQTNTNHSCFCLKDKYCNNCWFFDKWGNFINYKSTPKKNVGESVGETFLHTRSSLAIARNKEAFFFLRKEMLAKRLDRESMRLATKDKKPLKWGWTQSWFKEWLSKDKLLERYQEWSIRGGKRMGNKYLSFLDVDIVKEDMPLSLQQATKEKLMLVLNCLDCFYVETRKGHHVYMLSDELLPNEILYHADKFGKRRKIGSIQSKGKYVVGFDSKDKKLVENGKWFWHVKNLAEVKEKLGKFFIEVGKEKTEKRLVASDLIENIKCQIRDNIIEKPLKSASEVLNKLTQKLFRTANRQNIQAKVLNKQKIPWLADFVKVWYKNLATGAINYFLLNDYQHTNVLPKLDNGSVKSICLVQGAKHRFLNGLF